MNDARIEDLWHAFVIRLDAYPSPHAKSAFVAAMQAEATPTPYTHGDPRVDRWQTAIGGNHPPTDEDKIGPRTPAPPGFEPLAAWSPWTHAPEGTIWERPLRRLPVKEPSP